MFARLSTTAGVPVMLDRRIDPTSPRTLEARGQSVREVIDRAAQAVGGSPYFFPGLIYIVPAEKVGELESLAARDQAAIARRDSTLDAPITLSWPALSSPSELVTRALEGSGWRVANPGAIPFDLWPPMDGGRLSRREWLTVLLFGFGLTFEESGAGVLTVAEIPPQAKQGVAAPRPAARGRAPARVSIEEQRVTFVVRGEQAGRVLQSLASSFDLTLKVSPEAEARLKTPVTIEARQRTLDAVLALLGEAAGLRLTRAARQVAVDAQP
ncbi:hypothetical protein Pla175_19650 [Pirellulimonas nuda]|uniref:Uncharacterized protein n=2 Tax=Pirellulimonas nuda TaxID=2528009 RepID=A0A518DAS6_9BACT|nr:hypothetical protein Pla175_19650 [Pirellulimonas nuda]